MNRKGFFFIIVSFILLAYILTSTYYWVRAIEMEENRYSESFRTTSMEMLLAQVNEETIGNYVDISAHYAFYRLNHHSIKNPVYVPDGVNIEADSLDGSELENIRLAMRELVLSGTASEDYFEGEGLEYTPDEKLTYTLDGWASQLNASLAAAGFELAELSIDEDSFEFNQVNFTQFELVFEMNMTIVDTQADSDTSVVRSYEVRRLVDGTGFVDPYIARESDRHLNLQEEAEHVMVGKPIFLAPYWEQGFEYLCEDHDAGGGCYKAAQGDQGQGWFYGPLVMVEDANTIPENTTYNYILVGNYSDIRAVPNYEEFGAYILTNAPTEVGSSCASKNGQDDTFNPIEYDGDCDPYIDTGSNSYTERPFMVYEGFELSDGFEGVEFQPTWGEHMYKLLFISRANYEEVESDPELKLEEVSIYNIEYLRDFAMCGYYMPRNNSPSFLHRMFDLQDMFDSSSPDYTDWPESAWGFETLAVGRWAGGNIVPDAETWDEYSRVDVEFFSEVDGSGLNEVQMIKGMPGVKNRAMCNMLLVYDEDLEHVGHFRLSDWAQWDREEYDDIYWIETGDGEDDNIGCDNNEVANCEAG